MNDPITAAYTIGFVSGAVIAAVITTIVFRSYVAESVKAMKAILAVPVAPNEEESREHID